MLASWHVPPKKQPRRGIRLQTELATRTCHGGPGKLPWQARACQGSLPMELAKETCQGGLPRELAKGACHGNLPRELAKGACQESLPRERPPHSPLLPPHSVPFYHPLPFPLIPMSRVWSTPKLPLVWVVQNASGTWVFVCDIGMRGEGGKGGSSCYEGGRG